MSTSTPSSLQSFTVLRVTLPPQPAFPKAATHYMYLRPDAPKTPTNDTPRSIFLANIPIDSSEASLRALFKQIGGALVDRIDFEGQGRRTDVLVKGQSWASEDSKRGTKRKRDDAVDEKQFALPSTWLFRVHKSGSCAVAVFVDAATAQAVVKECARMAKRKESVEWRSTEELGEKRMWKAQIIR
jgi:ribosomal RNA-processing protein 7